MSKLKTIMLRQEIVKFVMTFKTSNFFSTKEHREEVFTKSTLEISSKNSFLSSKKKKISCLQLTLNKIDMSA